MRMKKVLLYILSVALVLAVTSCVPEAEPPPDSIIPSVTPSEPPVIVLPSGPAAANIFGIAASHTGSLNPITGTGRLNMEFMPLMYESLFYVDRNFEAVPLLCKAYTIEGSTVSLTLREDVLFWDDSGLTAQDVKYSLDLAAGGNTIYSVRLGSVSKVIVTSEYTVNIELSGEIGRFETLLDIPIIKKGTGSDYVPTGTGPYEYVEEGDELYLKADSDWWQGRRMEPARINLIDSPEADILIDAFETGTISVVGNDPSATDQLVFGGDYEEWSYPTGTMYYLGLNTTKAPFRNGGLRSILTYAIDRSFICEADLLRYGDPAVLPANPSSKLYDKTLADSHGFSLTEFSILYEELAASFGTIDFIVPSDNTYKVSTAKRISEDLRSMGVLINTRELKWDAYLASLNSGDFDMYLAEVKLTSNFDIRELIATNGQLNYGKYSSAATDELLTAFAAAGPGTAASEASNLYKHILDEAPIIPILFKRNVVLARRGELSEIDPIQNNIYNGLNDFACLESH